jgi:hypothetical protein
MPLFISILSAGTARQILKIPTEYPPLRRGALRHRYITARRELEAVEAGRNAPGDRVYENNVLPVVEAELPPHRDRSDQPMRADRPRRRPLFPASMRAVCCVGQTLESPDRLRPGKCIVNRRTRARLSPLDRERFGTSDELEQLVGDIGLPRLLGIVAKIVQLFRDVISGVMLGAVSHLIPSRTFGCSRLPGQPLD